MMRFGYTVQLLLLATVMADNSAGIVTSSSTAVAALSPADAYYPPQTNYDMDSICNNTIPLVAPSVGNPTLVEGHQTGHHAFPQCSNYVQYGGPAAAYKLTGTGDVWEATVFQGPDYQQSYLTVFRGCVEGGNADLAESAGSASNGDNSVDQSFPYPTDNHCVGGQSYDGARWKTEPGQEYTIIVHGSYQEPSEFVLNVAAIPASSVCGIENRTVPIKLGPVSLKKKISTIGTTYGGPSFLTDLPSCGSSFALSPTALYLVNVVNTNVLVKASVQGQGQISVYQGGCDVGGWTCAPTIQNFGNTQKVSWRNQRQGTKYLIAVNNYGSQAGAGDHLLAVSVSSYGNLCKDVTTATMQNFTERSNLADKKAFLGLTSCDDNSTLLTPTAFYKFTGTGQILVASIRDAYTISARLALYAVAACKNAAPKCLASDNYNQALSSPTVNGETYYLAVYSSSDFYDGKGNFTVNIQSVTSKELCSAATDVGIVTKAKSVKVSSTTTGASVITNLNACVQSPALAYSFTAGEAGMLSVKLHTPAITGTYSSALQLMVLEGSCANAACDYEQYMSYYDDYSFVAQSVEADKKYVVVVFGYGPDQTGPFDLSLELTQSGDPCSDAVVINTLADGLTVTGSTKNSSQYYFGNIGCSPSNSVPSMIYALQNDKDQWIGVSAQSNQMSPYVYVLEDSSSQGECTGQLSCNSDGGSYGNSGWSWKAKAGATYYVVVYGCCDSQQVGDFTLQFRVQETDAVCKEIVKLGTVSEVGLVTSVSMDGNSTKFYDLVNCYTYGSASESSVVYSFTAGITGKMIARAGFAMNSDVLISVYTESCESLACVGGTDSYTPLWFDVQNATTYYVAMSHANSYGYDSSSKFLLVLEPAEESNVISVNNKTGKVCSDVEDLGSIPDDGFLLIGTTKDMPSYPGLETCYDTPAASSGVRIYMISTESSGTSVSVAVDSIDFDVHVSVYEGACNGQLGCVQGHGAWRNVQFDAEPDAVYYVAVFGSDLSTGNFLLHIELASVGNLCNTSIPIASIPETGLSLTGSTENGRISNNLPTCNGYDQANSPALSYSVSGTGGMMTASVLDTFTGDDNSPQLVVYGNDCGSPQCIDIISGYNQVTWSSVLNASYFLAVTGCCDSQSPVQFELALNLVKGADLCTEALSLGTLGADGVTKTNSHSGYYYPALSNCSSSDSSQSVTGYSIVGTGDVFLADVSTGSGISVVAGNCVSMTCIGGYGYDSSVSWATEPNVLYYIAVFGDQTGNHTLTVKPISTGSICDGDGVTNLGTISEGGLVLQGSTISGTIFRGISPCANGDPHGLWTPSTAFKFKGDGGAYLLIVEDVSGFNAQINAYKGDCGDLACAKDKTYGQGMLLPTEVNAIYTVVVNDCCANQSGTFKLRIISAHAGDLETDAVDVDVPNSGLLVNGSTVEGDFYDLPTCYNAISGPGVAYRVHTTGIGSWTAFVTGFSVDAQISAYTLDGKGDPVCYGLYNWQQVSWTSDNPNQVVYIVVSGSDLSSGGDYALRVRNSATTVSNVCDGIVDLGSVQGQGVLKIDSIQGGNSNVNMSYCSYGTYYPSGDVPAALYKVQGTGALITASVFASSSGSSDVSVAPLIGSCGTFGCIADATSRSSRSVSWTGEAGQTYYIMVMACCGDTTFVLSAQETSTTSFVSRDGTNLVEADEAISLTEQEEHEETGSSSAAPTKFGCGYGYGYTYPILVCIGIYVLMQM